MILVRIIQGRAWCPVCRLLRAFHALAEMDLADLRCAKCGGVVVLTPGHEEGVDIRASA